MATQAAYHAPDRMPGESRKGRGRIKELDLVTLPPRQRIEARHGRIDDIPLLLRYGEAAIGVALAPEAVVKRVALAHPHSLWSFWRRDRLVGGAAILMLNPGGLGALLADRIDLNDPPLAILANRGERPAAIYIWAMLGGVVASEGIARAMVRMQQYPYERADIFGLPTTGDGRRFMRGFGLRTVPGHPRSLQRYVRLANRTQSSGEEVHECFSA